MDNQKPIESKSTNIKRRSFYGVLAGAITAVLSGFSIKSAISGKKARTRDSSEFASSGLFAERREDKMAKEPNYWRSFEELHRKSSEKSMRAVLENS